MKTKMVLPVRTFKRENLVNPRFVRSELQKKIDNHLTVLRNERKRTTAKNCDNLSEFKKCNINAKRATLFTEENLSTPELLHYIDSAMKLQQNAVETAVTTNRAYTVQLLLIFLEAFISFTFNFYYIISVIAQPASFKLSKSKAITYLTQQCSQQFVCVMVTVVGFSLVQSKFYETQQVVSKIIIYAQDNDVRSRFSAFSQQIQVNFPHFHVYRFFTLDGSVLFSMISATTTYLIILVQALGSQTGEKLSPPYGKANQSAQIN